VTTLFTVTISAMAVAGALAFGLGNRELAGRVTRDWYERLPSPRYRRFEGGPVDRPGIEERDAEDQPLDIPPHH
jgi:hypothetical protein